MSNYHVVFWEDADGNLVETDWYHHDCLPEDKAHDATAWPAPGDNIEGENCTACDKPLRDVLPEQVCLNCGVKYVAAADTCPANGRAHVWASSEGAEALWSRGIGAASGH